jgi:hypothetical protein
MSAIDADYLAAQIANVKATIVAYDTAILALATGAQNYQLDTGQTRQMVTKANLASLRDTRSELFNELATLDARLCGGVVRVIPSW